MGGVYRIQTFFGFLYFFYIYKAPKLALRPSYIQCMECVCTLSAFFFPPTIH